ncbi:RNA polymerase sigma factor SigZ [Halalkalibacter sp. AB-rgal2]|uniref:RNA polymerase sigma factor SigZ n=1 Tax=Halalkalibacter sp. AB-rgal2 TaxID=3242695 RepID=UPI00359E340E
MDIERLWLQFHEPLKKFVTQRVSDPANAEDIIQEVFMKITAHINTVKDEEKILPWIYKLTRNTIIDYYRKQKPSTKLPDQIEVHDVSTDPNFNSELAMCITPMINQLPAIYKEAIKLTQLDGMSQKKLSEHLGLSFSGAKSRVQRGKKNLKKILTNCCHIESDRYGNIIEYRLNKTNAPSYCHNHKCNAN